MMIAAFLDRDGVINEEVNLLHKPEQLALIPGSAAGIRMLNEAGILAIIVSNQPVVARNLASEEEVRHVHDVLLDMLRKEGARIDAVYYCPHHPETHHPEAQDPRYRRACNCRKPATGMIDEAKKRFKIDLKNSFVVGDRSADILQGKNAGCTAILVETGYGGKDAVYTAKADYRCPDLAAACRLIVQRAKEQS